MDLYFEMYSGIAGDMIIGSLLDLGANKEKLIEDIASLKLSDYELVFDRVKKNGISAYNFDVILKEEHSHHEQEAHHHCHNHCHNHDHEHNHDHDHSHGHEHRNLRTIRNIIENSKLNDNIKKNALGIFEIIADAEAKAHGIDKEEVHFHEVGAVDSIIDIVGACVLLDDLDVKNLYFSKLYEGVGYQPCAHGPMPIPVPAVANIINNLDLPLNIIDEEGEHITPTGAAFVKYFYKKPLTEFKIKNIGLGAGNKDFEKSTNVLRVMEIEEGKKKL